MADVSAPYVTDISPSNGSSSIAINAPISFKVLDTPEVGSLGFTSIGIEDYWKNDDVSAQADGIITVFTTTGALPYRPGTLQAFIDGILYDVVETNPEMGQFSFGIAPSAGVVVVVRYMNAIYLNCVDISSVYIAIDGVPAFVSGTWQLGYGGTITPVDYGYSFNVTTHPVFGYNTVITVEVGAQDLAEPVPNVLTTSIVTTFTTIASTAYSTPYIVNENPVNGTVGVVTTSPIDFDIKTDLGTTIILSSINVFVNSELLIKNGVPQVHPTYVASVPSLIPQGYHINIQAVSGTLAIQYYRVSMNAVDDYIVPPSLTGVYGEDFFEFSTDIFDFLFKK